MTAVAFSPEAGICVGESGEHGLYRAVRGKVHCKTAGTGTNTIVIEVDDSPTFPSPVTIFTINLGTSTEADSTALQNRWLEGDNFVRARCTAVGATAPQEVVAELFFHQKMFEG